MEIQYWMSFLFLFFCTTTTTTNSTFLITIVASNLPGAVASFAFVAISLPLIPTEDTSARRNVTIVLSGGAAALLALWTYFVFAKVEHERLVFLLGAFASVICVLMFASPLSTVREVVATANAASIYGPLTATQCTNC